MTLLTPAQLVSIARQHVAAGRYAAAEPLCRKVLAGDRGCTEAWRLLATMAEKTSGAEAAAAFFRQAVAVEPEDPGLHAELGRLYRQLGRGEEATAAFRRWVELEPANGAAWRNLADALLEKGDFEEAAGGYRRVLALDAVAPADGAAANAGAAVMHTNLGQALLSLGRLDEAMAACRQALALDPNIAEAHEHLGVALQRQGQFAAALESLARALEIDASAAQTYVYRAQALHALGQTEDAVAACRRALLLRPGDAALVAQMPESVREKAALDLEIIQHGEAAARQPGDAEAHFRLGLALQYRRRFEAAIEAYHQALELQADHVGALNNLGLILEHQGELDGALEYLRRAVKLHPEVPTCHSSLLCLLHFHPAYGAAEIHRLHQPWRLRHTERLKAQIQPYANDRSPQRRLRVGYVSPDFRAHPVGRFMNAFLGAHDRGQFEVVCYSSVPREDVVTQSIRGKVDRWVDARHLSDAALARQVRDDGIDILVDLTMHLAYNRMLMFARKPAPVQVTYLAYCSTTGLDTIDYRLTDGYLDPQNLPQDPRVSAPDSNGDGRCYTEKSVHLPVSYWCYHPGVETPEVNSLPALDCGHVTFASLNNFGKVSPAALDLWARILEALPGSRLILHAAEGRHRGRIQGLFAARGVGPERLEFFDLLELPQFFAQLQRIDLALDSFPYPGGTTTCDALWMGVPTVSLVGQAAFHRSGLSILSNAGLPELATYSQEEYLATVLELARDLPRLAELRGTMRLRLLGSPLMDAPRFARDLEAAYRAMWRRWCRT